jgi:hypothetical protein
MKEGGRRLKGRQRKGMQTGEEDEGRMGEKGERRQKKGFADQQMMEWGEEGSRETGKKRR